MRTDSVLEYHRSELAIALDSTNPARTMPPILPRYRSILDIGCGMGQTLLGAGLPPDVVAYGVDCDQEAINVGRSLVPSNIHLECCTGEKLPFDDKYFDLVFSRVALPYMEINQALKEISRVVKDDGDVWLALHPASKLFAKIADATKHGNVKSLLFSSYVLLNSVSFNYCGLQFRFNGRQETFQTLGGISKAMERAGLACVPIETADHFIVEGRKVH